MYESPHIMSVATVHSGYGTGMGCLPNWVYSQNVVVWVNYGLIYNIAAGAIWVAGVVVVVGALLVWLVCVIPPPCT